MLYNSDDILASLPRDLKAIRGLAITLRQRRLQGDFDTAATLDATAEVIAQLGARVQYLDESLTAAVTGELPEKFDLNQMLLAKRAKGYIEYIKGVDPRDKLVEKK